MMQTTVTFGQQAFVRAYPISAPVFAHAAGSTSVLVDATPICGNGRVSDAAVLEGDFPGTSAWRPPNPE